MGRSSDTGAKGPAGTGPAGGLPGIRSARSGLGASALLLLAVLLLQLVGAARAVTVPVTRAPGATPAPVAARPLLRISRSPSRPIGANEARERAPSRPEAISRADGRTLVGAQSHQRPSEARAVRLAGPRRWPAACADVSFAWRGGIRAALIPSNGADVVLRC